MGEEKTLGAVVLLALRLIVAWLALRTSLLNLVSFGMVTNFITL